MLVTPDDFLRLKGRILDAARLGNLYAMNVFDKLVADIEPRLVITEPGGAAEWYERVILTRSAIANGSLGVSPSMLDQLTAVAAKYMRLVGPEPQRAFPFMHAPDLRAVAEADWTRLVAAGQREDAKTVAITAGSVIEAVALDIIERLSGPDAGKLRDHVNALPPALRMNLRPAKGAASDWPFAFLLVALGPPGLKILTPRTHDIGHKLRDWRNLIHPNEARSEQLLTAADGRMAAGFAEKVVEEVEAWTAQGANLVVPS